MKKIIVLLAVLAMGAAKVNAQEYNWAVGVRGGFDMLGITVKHNFDPANAIEVYLDFTHKFNVYALYERHIPVISKGFNFYYGGGINMGAWGDKFTMGINGIVGLEYKIQSIPLAFSIDYKPVLNFAGQTGFYAGGLGAGIKVAF